MSVDTYECYCMDCCQTIEKPPGWTEREFEAWFCEDDELKLCTKCQDEGFSNDILHAPFLVQPALGESGSSVEDS